MMSQATSPKSPANSANKMSGGDFVPSFVPSTSHNTAALWVLLLVLAVTRLRALTLIETDFIGGTQGDAGLYIWLMQSNIRDLFTLPWFNTAAFYPYTRTLAWSDNFILPSLFALPFIKLGAPLVIVYNCIILAANFLNGYIMYRLCFRLTGKQVAALFGGASFMSYSFLTGHLGHPQLQFAFWLPLACLLIMRFYSKPALIWAILAGLTFVGAFLCGVYYAVFVAMLLVALFFGVLLIRPSYLSLRQFFTFVGGVILGVLPVIPFLLPYQDTLATFGPRKLYEAYYFAANSLSYLSATPFNLIYSATSKWSHAEANLFPGFIVIGVALLAFNRLASSKQVAFSAISTIAVAVAIALLLHPALTGPHQRLAAAMLCWIALALFANLAFSVARIEKKLGFNIITNRNLISIFLFTALLAVFLSFGPLGNPEKGELAVGPYTVFHSLFPGFSAVRASARIGILAVFCVIVAGALAIGYLGEKLKGGSANLLVLVIPLCVIENFSYIFPLDKLAPPGSVYSYLAQQPRAGDAMVSLPLAPTLTKNNNVASWGSFAIANVDYMLASFDSGRPTVNGWSGHRTHIMREFPRELRNFPDERSIAALKRIAGLRYIVYAQKFDPEFNHELFNKKLEQSASSLTLIMQDDQGNYLFELTGLTEIDENLSLMVPAFPERVLTMEILPVFSKQLELVTLELFIPELFGENAIHSVTLKTDGTSQTVQFPMPTAANRTRPLTLKFRIKSEEPLPAKIMLHRTRVD